MKGRVVIHFNDVSFELLEGNNNPGIFTLYLLGDEYRFDWIPQNPDLYADDDLSVEQFHVIIRLSEIHEIIRHNESMSTISLCFVLHDQSRLPLFRFRSNPYPLIEHLFEFLKFKNFVTQNRISPNNYTVSFSHPSNSVKLDPTTYVTPLQAIAFASHKRIIANLLVGSTSRDPLTVDEVLQYFDVSGRIQKYNELKREIYFRGLTQEARPLIWPYLFGTYNSLDTKVGNQLLFKDRIREYEALSAQRDAITDQQKKFVREFQKVANVLEHDVLRTDRSTDQFKGDDNPNLDVLRHVLLSFSMYNRDAGYVQGMGDILAVLITLFIKKWENYDTAIMFDGTKQSRLEAESFLLSLMIGLMEKSQMDRLFNDLDTHPKLVLERSYEIASVVHKPLSKWLADNDLQSIFFMCRPFLLMFKRDFELPIVMRLWDAIFASQDPPSFIRCIVAAVLILLFPKLMLHTNGSLEETIALSDKTIPKLDGKLVIALSIQLMQAVQNSEEHWSLGSLPEQTEYRKYSPTYLKLVE